MVPDSVMTEISARWPGDRTRQAVQDASWIERSDHGSIKAEIAAWGLGPGESAVLAMSAEMSDVEAILDDQSARRCARALGSSVRGTLGLILLAKNRGMIPAARPVLEDLIRGGMYPSGPTLDKALQRVGE